MLSHNIVTVKSGVRLKRIICFIQPKTNISISVEQIIQIYISQIWTEFNDLFSQNERQVARELK